MHAIERIHTFVAQDGGYYSAWIFNDQYARVEMTNLFFCAQDMHGATSKKQRKYKKRYQIFMITTIILLVALIMALLL